MVYRNSVLFIVFMLFLAACEGGEGTEDAGTDADATDTADVSTESDAIEEATPDSIPDIIEDSDEPDTAGAWPTPNAWSWDGSWEPAEFPLDGLLDNEYFDGHPDIHGTPTPILPPGEWDWNDDDNDLANWRNFSTSSSRNGERSQAENPCALSWSRDANNRFQGLKAPVNRSQPLKGW